MDLAEWNPRSEDAAMRLRPWILVVCAAVLLFLSAREWSLKPDGRFHVRFLAVGEGDSALLTLPGGDRVLIDGGPDWSTLTHLGRLLPFFDRRIDTLIVTHPDLDHIGAFAQILRRYNVHRLVVPGLADPSPCYRAVLAAAADRNTVILPLSAGNILALGDGAMMNVLWPPSVLPKGFPKGDNNRALVLMLSSQSKRILFTSDIEARVEETLVAAHADLAASILKVAHHGSNTSSGTGFLLAVHPTLAIISVGPNDFGHPRPEILRRFRFLGIPVRRTDDEGTVEVVW